MFKRLFAKPAAPAPEMWQPGDLAEYTGTGDWYNIEQGAHADGPAPRQRLVVAAVHFGICPGCGSGNFLTFARFGRRGWCASEFRKVQPRADDPVAASASWVRDTFKNPLTLSLSKGHPGEARR